MNKTPEQLLKTGIEAINLASLRMEVFASEYGQDKTLSHHEIKEIMLEAKEGLQQVFGQFEVWRERVKEAIIANDELKDRIKELESK